MAAKVETNVQDMLLSKAKEQKIPVVLYTTNGFQIRGVVLDYDDLSIVVKSDKKEQMIYKHALSTVALFQQDRQGDRIQL